MPMETYWTFAALLLAGRKIAIATGAAEYAEAIAELVENGNGLKAALRDAGLAPLAREMERLATEALAFTHPRPRSRRRGGDLLAGRARRLGRP